MSSIDRTNNNDTFGDLDDLLPLAKPRYDGDETIEERWVGFHAANPHVYKLLRNMALNLKRRGFQHCGIALLWERLRWLSYIETYGLEEYKFSNSHRAFYARLIMQEEPELAGFFHIRHQPAVEDAEE